MTVKVLQVLSNVTFTKKSFHRETIRNKSSNFLLSEHIIVFFIIVISFSIKIIKHTQSSRYSVCFWS